ncbi:hypothetical protein GX586_06845 [bacterium]|nr:hypothetical protein [bacterium]
MANALTFIDAHLFDLQKANVLAAMLIIGGLILYYIYHARRGKSLFIRRIPGLESVEEAIGRATELGKPILYVSGIGTQDNMATIAAMNILGYVAEHVAHYDTDLTVPCIDPIVMTIEQEVVRNSYARAGRPENYREEHIYFATNQQFPYAMAVSGTIIRDRPAANFFLGSFAAEALILAEAGASTDAIQIAGTDQVAQIPFFIVACDYTLIGEELFAASAYLSREPLLLGSLKGQDASKLIIIAALVAGIALVSVQVFVTTDVSSWFARLFAVVTG